MEIPTKTSQTEWSRPEGSSSPSAPAVSWGTDKAAPGGVTEPVKGEIKKIGIPTISQTERHLPEGK